MFNINFLNAIALIFLFSIIKYQSELKTKTYLCFKARKLIYVSSYKPLKITKEDKCFITLRFSHAQQSRLKKLLKNKS